MKTVSVIIPVYNAETTIVAAVESILAQSYPVFEIILVNDGSMDSSSHICDELSDLHDCVSVIHKPNAGVSSARNAGLEAASGDYVMFVDADDILHSDALDKLMLWDSDLMVGGFRKVAADGRTLMSAVPLFSRTYSGVHEISQFFDDTVGDKDCYLLNSSCFKLYRRSLIEEKGLRFDETLRYGEDKIFVFEFLQYVGLVSTLPVVLYDYNIAGDSLSSDVVSDAHLSQLIILMERYVPLLSGLAGKYSYSSRLRELYHKDVVSRYVFRILTCFATGPSELLTRKNIELMYAYMRMDTSLSLSAVRTGQIVNYLLYRLGCPGFTVRFYSLSSRIFRYISFK